MASSRARQLVITSGDPCGIGPEVILKALRRARLGRRPVTVIGSLPVFRDTARRLRMPLPRWSVVSWSAAAPAPDAPLVFLDCATPHRFVPGRIHHAAGGASLAYLTAALALWRAGRLAALVTGPVSKAGVARALPGFTGHTEFLARRTRTREVVMMFASDTMRVALITRHLPLRRVPGAITAGLAERTIETVARALTRQFRIARPRLAVCGIDPHAGELAPGSDDARRLVPALRSLRRRGIVCDGPFAADGLFASDWRRYDAIISPYHDQGLIPFKMLARDRGCQISLGLPFVRTSPDHGTAFDIAGRGTADPGSMAYAIAQAVRLC